MSTHGSRRVILAAFFANFAIMICKFIAAGVTGSTAMLAEGFHSIADTGNQLLLLVGMWLSTRPADQLHPFGYGKENYFWAFVVAMTMFVVGAVVSIWQGVEKLLHPHALESLHWAVGVLLAGMVLEGAALAFAVHHVWPRLGGHSLWRYVRRSKEPATITVLLEDSAALIGLSIALAGLLVAHFTGLNYFDGLASIGIGVLLAVVAVLLARETKSLLVGESVLPEMRQKIVDLLFEVAEVQQVLELRTMHLGPNKVLLVARLHLRDGLDTDQIEELLNRIEAAVREEVPIVQHCYLEADRPVAPENEPPE